MNKKPNKKPSNLVNILANLSKFELNKLRKFITSPYFNKNEKVILLFDLINKDIRAQRDLKKEQYFKKIFKTTSYNDQQYRNLNSELFKLVIKFLAQEEYEKAHANQANFLIKAVKEKNLFQVYDKAVSTAHKWMDKHKLRNSEYYLQRYKLENNIFKLTSEFEKKTKIKKNHEHLDILEINDQLDYFYMTEKLRYYNSYLSWKTMSKITYDFPYIDKVLAIVKTYKKSLPPALQIYYSVYKISIDSNDVKSYQDLKVQIHDYLNHFDKYEAYVVYSFLLNFAIKQINKGNADFYEELFELYNFAIDQKIIFENDYLSPTSYRNTVTLALRLKKFDWAAKHIPIYAQYIKEKHRDNAYKYNLARLYFYEKQYDKVLETVREVEFNDPLYANMSKSMILVSYYELYDEEALEYYADSFNAYMRRSKGISDRVRKEYLNLIKFIKRMNKARYNPSLLVKLKKEILNSKELASKQWFLEKLEHVKIDEHE